jgi:rRNA maturation endonuclease Nob1
MDYQCQECFEFFEEGVMPCPICGSEVVIPVDFISSQSDWDDGY